MTAPPKRLRGRPKSSELGHNTLVRLQPDLREFLQAEADSLGIALSTHIRMLLSQYRNASKIDR